MLDTPRTRMQFGPERRLRSGAFLPLAAVGLLAVAGCGDSAPGLAPLARAPLVTTPSTAAHEQYAQRGLTCAACHPCGAKAGHPATWMDPTSPGFHAYSANRGLAACQECHGAALDGGSGASTACARCHGAAWKTNCIMCHGATDNGTGAPPRPTWGSTSPVAVGAHSSHVGLNPVSAPMSCGECHPTPTDALSPGHLDGSVAVAFVGPVSGLAATGTWNYPSSGSPTCSSTYCHGNFTRGSLTNTPSWTGTGQAACGSCHASRPRAYLHQRHQRSTDAGVVAWWPLPGGSTWVTCDDCHSGIAQSTSSLGTPALTVGNGSGPALHVDGKADVVFESGGSYTIDPWLGGTCSSMACHPGEVKYWPR